MMKDGKAKNIVIDIDRRGLITAAQIAAATYKIDNNLIPFRSPSGEEMAYYGNFYHEAKPTKELLC